MGSYYSRKILRQADSRLMILLAVVAVLVAILAVLITAFLSKLVGLPIEAKVLLTILMVFPAGFAMGMPFPSALARLEAFHKPALRWAWSLNAASSVLGSVGALVCAVYLGLMQTLLVGGGLYLCALLVFSLSARALAVPLPGFRGIKIGTEENVRS